MEQTKQKWPKEPWVVGVSRGRDKWPVFRLVEMETASDEEASAVAQRAQSCVNALSGEPDPAKFVAEANEAKVDIESIRNGCDCLNEACAGVRSKIHLAIRDSHMWEDRATRSLDNSEKIEKQRDALLKAAREVITFPFDQKPREDLKDAIAKNKAPN